LGNREIGSPETFFEFLDLNMSRGRTPAKGQT
jgi:hypothetical protein